jgi:hypothetical protein
VQLVTQNSAARYFLLGVLSCTRRWVTTAHSRSNRKSKILSVYTYGGVCTCLKRGLIQKHRTLIRNSYIYCRMLLLWTKEMSRINGISAPRAPRFFLSTKARHVRMQAHMNKTPIALFCSSASSGQLHRRPPNNKNSRRGGTVCEFCSSREPTNLNAAESGMKPSLENVCAYRNSATITSSQ